MILYKGFYKELSSFKIALPSYISLAMRTQAVQVTAQLLLIVFLSPS